MYMKATCDVRLSQADCVNYIMNYTKDSDLVATESCMTNNSLLVETVKLNLPWCVRQWGYGGGAFVHSTALYSIVAPECTQKLDP